jgi:putative peptidoglycan lipid II flippase
MHFWPLKSAETPNRKILRAAVIVGLMGLVAKISATVKELIVAGRFGRSDALDAFLIALLLPAFTMILVRAAFEAALIPALVDVRQSQGPQAAQKLVSSTMFFSVMAWLALSILLGVLAPYYLPYLGSGFSPEKLRLTRHLVYVLLPYVFFNGLSGCAAAVLNAGEKFALPALTPLLTPLVMIVFITLGPSGWGPFLLAAGVVAGGFLESVLLVQALRIEGMHLWPHWSGRDPLVSRVLAQFAPMLAGAFLMSSTSVVDQSMAAMLPGGSVAALSYANKIVAVITAVGASALSTAALPYLSRMVADGDWNGCRHTLKRYSLLIVATTVPLTLGLIAFSRPLVRLLFQRGAFTPADTELVSWVQICYLAQIPFYVLSMFFVRFLSSVRRNHALMYASGINLILDIVLNLLLMRRWGIAGLAMSTSLMYAFSLLFVATWSVRFLAQQRMRIVGEEPATAG